MSFSHPWLLSLGGLIVLLGIFYFLKVRPERHATALLFLWESVVPDKKYSALFRRLRDLWSFLLMASAFALITLALAGLHGNAGADRRDLLMVVDLSPSMAVEHAGVSRREEVRLALAGIIENLADGQRMTLAAASGASLTVVQNATDNRRALRRALESLSVGDEPLKPAALELLQYWRAALPDGRLVLWSDGGFTRRNAFELPAALELGKVGCPVDNVGIVNLELLRLPDGALQSWVEIFSGNDQPVELDLVIAEGAPEAERQRLHLAIQPGGQRIPLLPIPAAQAGLWYYRLELPERDALAADNEVVAVLPAVPQFEVACLGNSPALRRLFRTWLAGGPFRASGGTPQLIIGSGSVEPVEHCNHYIVWAPEGESAWWQETADAAAETAILEVRQPEHPAMRWCDIDGIEVGGVRPLRPPDNALVLAESADGLPLIYLTEQAGRRIYVLNFDPESADFALRLAFPVLNGSMAMELLGNRQSPAGLYRIGDRLPGTGGVLQTPSGRTIAIDDAGVRLTESGIYTLQRGAASYRLAAALLDRTTSDTDNSAVVSTVQALNAGPSLLRWLFVAALLLLGVEEWLYHWRKVG